MMRPVPAAADGTEGYQTTTTAATTSARAPSTKNGTRQLVAARMLPDGTPTTWAMDRPAAPYPIADTTRPAGTTTGIVAQICGTTSDAAIPASTRNTII